MRRPGRAFFWLLTAVAAASGGYVWWDHLRSTADEKLEAELKPDTGSTLKPAPPTPRKEELRLQLKAGELFPLVKTIEETITQQTEDGPLRSITRIQLVLSLRVEEVHPDRKRLRVDYRRVRFEQDLAGEKLLYDSAAPPAVIPPQVQAYHGLVNNGFSFWIGPDNRILQLEDFAGFLERCMAHVPPDQRRAVMNRFLKTSGDEGVANFVDDSIGLLPYQNRAVKVGDHWSRQRRVLRPVPLFLTQTCTLKRLQGNLAEIEIRGEIAPTATYGPAEQPQGGLQLTVRGGKTVGLCRIRTATGLPERSEINHLYDLVVRYPDGRRFNQTKKTRTVIEVFSPQGQPKTIGTATWPVPSTLPTPTNDRRGAGIRQTSVP